MADPKSLRSFRGIWSPSDLAHPEPVSSLWIAHDENPYVRDMVADGTLESLSPHVVQLNFANVGGSGMQTTVVLSDAVSVHVIDAVFPTPARAQIYADESVVMLRASLSCDCAYSVPGMPAIAFVRPEIVFVHLPKGAIVQLDLAADSRQHGIHAYIKRGELLRMLDIEPASLPPQLARAIGGDDTFGRLISLPLDAQLADLVDSMTRLSADIDLYRLMLRGKLLQLMAQLIGIAGRSAGVAGTGGLRQREIDAAYQAREILDRTYRDPPLFAELALQVGTNRNRLKSLFREVFGMTLSDYCTQRRIREAQAMLLEGRLSIGQIAEQVGYEHQSSFTAAFREHAGMTPREYGRQRAALDLSLAPSAGRRPRAKPA